MPSITVENYLKNIYFEQQNLAGQRVPTGVLADAMQVTPGTATTMVKTLAGLNLLEYEPREGVRLTKSGSRMALQVLRRHRLIELFLVKTLKLDWAEVHDEAEILEHAVSDKVLDRIDHLLGYPKTDPHGDPIPAADATPPPRLKLSTLIDCPLNTALVISRIVDQDPEFLRFADQRGLTPGTQVLITERDPTADAVTVQPVGSNAVTLGTRAASKILVQN